MFEVVLAMALISIVLISVVMLATISVRTATFSRTKTQATRLTQEGIEWVRAQRDMGWSAFAANAATPTWCLPTLVWNSPGGCSATNFVANTQIIREGRFVIIDPNTVETNIETSWTDAQGEHIVNTSTYFTKWR